MRLFSLLMFMLLLLVPVQAQEAAAGAAPADALIRILEDDTARAELIERLRQAAPAEAAEAAAPADLSIARQLAEYTRSVAQGASSTIRALGAALTNLRGVLDGTLNADLGGLGDILTGLAILAVGLFGSYFLLRLIANALMARLLARSAGKSLISRIMAGFLAGVIDGVTILLAWALGYVIALNTGVLPNGQMGINQTLLLNAFLFVEVSKLVVRVLLAPRHPGRRFLPIADGNAAYWSFWAGRMTSLIGYTFLFISPMLVAAALPAVAAAVQVLVMATAISIGVVIVLQNRGDVRLWLTEVSARRGDDGVGRLLVVLGMYWHVLVITYLLTLLLVWFANPERALPFMLAATVQSLIAIVVGTVIAGFVSRFVSGGLKVPADVRERLPLLESRLQAFVPRVMEVVRWVVIVGVLVAIAQAWNVFDFMGWISSDDGLALAGSVISAALIVLVAIVLHVVVASWVEFRLNTKIGKTPTAREKTLLNLFKNAFTVALMVFGLMLALAQIGVNIAPLLAGAGVVGLAIGFGAQKLVQDIITGIFIQFENVMNEGDVVEVAGRSGVVEKLTIRSVTIRDMSGTIHLIPFSSVDQVSNMVRGFSFYVAEIEVAYDSDIEAVKQAMHDAFDAVMETEHRDVILDELDLQGLIALTPSSMTLRARIKTLAGKQWGAGRFYSERVKRLFSERGIRTPTPRVSYVPGLNSPQGSDEGAG